MLIRFTASNHRSVGPPIELSFVAVDKDRESVRTFDRLSEGLLPIAAIYGPNASGKSNVLDALGWLGAAVRNSLRAWDDGVPREPFRFGGYADKPSEFEVELMVEDVRYTYRLDVDDHSVLYEELLSYPERRARTLLAREGEELYLRRGLSGLSGIRELLTPVTLALSAARRFHVPEVSLAARALSYISAHNQRRRYTEMGSGGGGYRTSQPAPAALHSTRRLFLEAARSKEDEREALFAVPDNHRDFMTALTLLRFADLGIEDVKVVENAGVMDERPRRDLALIHRSGDESVSFQLHDESDGTQTWFGLIGPALAALRSGRVLLFDEIDASLHPRLSARLLDLFRNPRTNRLGAQLVFTTHDTALLGELNRDEVWLTEKGDDGATSLTALAEFGGDLVRRSLNLERAYLQGRFGALPDLDEGPMLGVLEENFDEGRHSAPE